MNTLLSHIQLVIYLYWLSVTGADEEAEIQTVGMQLSCHTRTCMKFQAGDGQQFVKAKSSFSYDRTGVYI